MTALYLALGALLIAVGGTLVAVALRSRTVYYEARNDDE